ncbi:N-acetyl-alpha-D-glucosaminyl L-malate synthase BshA [Fodinisporobacter ferrooxydans]|uniref:N-acetyl-alpha-D-glucosaminyl L-malate synthase BshA n=1 Tax=Fodinisporobacter ferrooxydans TaxID=2901836 RepID=A0ABY4CGQ8_9BACL|nr:N-acetyl-alpha-D-glucosaminyl L-malate synthase BshA [Alicyclobacillaceae bacterium MYW30-H2]
MNIGISCYPTLGGSGVLATELGKALASRGHKVHIISDAIPFRLLGEFHENIMFHEVDVANYALFKNPPHELSLATKLAEVIEYAELDILHSHYAIPHAVCAYLAKEMRPESRVKIITTLHGTDITVLAQDRSLRDMIRFGIEKSDLVTAVSDSLVKQTEELFRPRCPIRRVYNFVDPNTYRRIDVKQMRNCFAKPEQKILLHASNFRAVKRVLDVVEVFDRVQQTVPSVLLLVGEGPELAKVRQIVKEKHLESNVKFLGKQDEVAKLYSLADLFVLPSEKESFGLVALEAMACGVPVIGSDAGGIPEVVEHGKCGYLYPVGDVQSMAEGAIQLLLDDHLHASFAVYARKRVLDRFTLEDLVNEYERLYQLAIDGKPCYDYAKSV